MPTLNQILAILDGKGLCTEMVESCDISNLLDICPKCVHRIYRTLGGDCGLLKYGKWGLAEAES